MKTLFLKDFRENLKLALIGLLIFSLLLLQSYRNCIRDLVSLLNGQYYGDNESMQPLLASGFLMQEIFFCAIFAAALGWLQTRNEAHRDLWAFMVHRPITRTKIFCGKSFAGLCLYFLGAGLPLLVLITVIKIPGHIAAPFEWPMVVPSLLILFGGVTFYFAGMLTGLRQARWYVSRAFGLGLAILCSAGIIAIPILWVTSILIVVISAVLATAAWGGYQNGGFYRGQPAIGRFATTLAVAAGCGAVLFVATGLISELILSPLSHHSQVYSRYQMMRDGKIYKQTMRDNQLVDIVDLEGKVLMDRKTGKPMDLKEFQKHLTYGSSVHSRFAEVLGIGDFFTQEKGFYKLWNVTDKTLWFMDRHGRMTGYDGLARKYIGSIEAHGYDGRLAFDPFVVQSVSYYNYNSYNDPAQKSIASAKTVYQVDFKERTVTPIFTLRDDDEIGGYTEQADDFYGDRTIRDVFITTRKTVQLMNNKGEILFDLPYQPPYSQYPNVQVSVIQPTDKSERNFAVWYHPNLATNIASGWKLPMHLVWTGSQNALEKTLDLPVLRWPDNGDNSKLWLILYSVVTLVCVGVVWLLAGRYNFLMKARLGWTFLALLLGPAGLFAFVCVQEFPAREICPDCKKLRTVDRKSCEHCEAEFSPPARNGTEIFANLEKV